MVSNVNKVGTQKGGEGGEQHKGNKVAKVGREGTAQGKLMRCMGYCDFCLTSLKWQTRSLHVYFLFHLLLSGKTKTATL